MQQNLRKETLMAEPSGLTIEALRTRLDKTFTPNSQRHNEATMALAGLKTSLERLAAHGMPLWLTDAPPFEGQEYPMALQHSVHGHMTVANKWEEDEARKAGWRRHPTLEAKRAGPKGPGGRGLFAAYYAARPSAAPGIFAAYHAAPRPPVRR